MEENLECETQHELELHRVERRRRLAVVSAAARTLVIEIDHLIERVAGRLVKAVKEGEALGDDVQLNTLAQVDAARETRVDREVVVRDAHITTQRSVRREHAL